MTTPPANTGVPGVEAPMPMFQMSDPVSACLVFQLALGYLNENMSVIFLH